MFIPFKIKNGSICMTLCPNGKSAKVMSMQCENVCEFFVSEDIKNRTMECSYPISKEKK